MKMGQPDIFRLAATFCNAGSEKLLQARRKIQGLYVCLRTKLEPSASHVIRFLYRKIFNANIAIWFGLRLQYNSHPIKYSSLKKDKLPLQD